MMIIGQRVRVQYLPTYNDMKGFVKVHEGDVGTIQKIVLNGEDNLFWEKGTYFCHVYFDNGVWGIWENFNLIPV